MAGRPSLLPWPIVHAALLTLGPGCSGIVTGADSDVGTAGAPSSGGRSGVIAAADDDPPTPAGGSPAGVGSSGSPSSGATGGADAAAGASLGGSPAGGAAPADDGGAGGSGGDVGAAAGGATSLGGAAAGGMASGGAGGSASGGSGGSGDPFQPVNFPGCSTEFSASASGESGVSWLFGGTGTAPVLDPVAGRTGAFAMIADPTSSGAAPTLEVTQPGIGCAEEKVLLGRATQGGSAYGARLEATFLASGTDDLSAYAGVRFLMAEMSGTNPYVQIDLEDADSTPAARGGSCTTTCDEHFGIQRRAFATWVKHTVCFTDLAPPAGSSRSAPALSQAVRLAFTVGTNGKTDLFMGRLALLTSCP